MTMQVNKEGVDWKLIKAELHTRIAEAQEAMLSFIPMEEYHRLRGSIMLAKSVIDWVEPTTPPETTEDNYDISDPE